MFKNNLTSQTTAEIYKKIKPSVVAIVSKLSLNPDFPDIIGTGFIAHEDGVILTNNHVIEAIDRLPRRKGDSSIPIKILLLHNIPQEGMATIWLDVEGVTSTKLEKKVDRSNFYGEDIPDIGAIYVKAKGLPAVSISESLNVQEGDEVLISGFPMGTDTLRSIGWIHQLSPILQKGIVSAILPFVCESPHAILVEAVTHGGSSGSPIFNAKDGEVIGILFGGLPEIKTMHNLKDGTILRYSNSTSLTYAIPTPLLNIMFKKLLKPTDSATGKELIRDVNLYQSLEEIISTHKRIMHKPKEISTEGLEVVGSDDVITPTSEQ